MPATIYHAVVETETRPTAHAGEARPRPLERMVPRLDAQLRHRGRLVARGDIERLRHVNPAIVVGAMHVAFREPSSMNERVARAGILLKRVWPQPDGALHEGVALLLTTAWALDLRRDGVALPAGAARSWPATGKGTPAADPIGAPGEELGRRACGTLGELVVAMDRARRDARALFARGQALAARAATANGVALGARLCCLPASSGIEAMAKSEALRAIAGELRSSSGTASTLVTIAAQAEWARWRSA